MTNMPLEEFKQKVFLAVFAANVFFLLIIFCAMLINAYLDVIGIPYHGIITPILFILFSYPLKKIAYWMLKE